MNAVRKPIVVVGSVTMDMVTLTPRIPRTGETVIGTGFGTTPGGKGANQAVAAARLGYPVHMVGNVGRDVYGPVLLNDLAGAGVGITAMEKVDGPSGLAPIFLSESGENAIVVVPGANGEVDCGRDQALRVAAIRFSGDCFALASPRSPNARSPNDRIGRRREESDVDVYAARSNRTSGHQPAFLG